MGNKTESRKAYLNTSFLELKRALESTETSHLSTIVNVAEKLIECYQNGGKTIIFGNGGSFADAQHFAGELEGAYKNRSRPALAALTPSNTAALTAIANDFGYEDVFRKFVEGNVKSKDVVIGLSTSGNSDNVIKALEYAKEKGAVTVAFTGDTGGKLKDKVDYLFNVPSINTPRIQEVHHFVYHEICGMVERELFS